MHAPRSHPVHMPAGRVALAAACLALPVLAVAQAPQLRLPSFSSLREQATESVDITLGWMSLHLMAWLMDDRDPDSAEVKKTLRGLKSVQIRNYSFDSDFAYPQQEIDALRAQLSQPGWSRLVQVRNREKQEDVDIYVALEDHTVRGLAIIACEPRELTVLNIVGTVDLEQVARLRRTLTPHDKHSALALNLSP
jgi:uncharacterized protein DUF4252